MSGIFVRFEPNLNFLTYFNESSQYEISEESVLWEWRCSIWTGGQTNLQTWWSWYLLFAALRMCLKCWSLFLQEACVVFTEKRFTIFCAYVAEVILTVNVSLICTLHDCSELHTRSLSTAIDIEALNTLHVKYYIACSVQCAVEKWAVVRTSFIWNHWGGGMLPLAL